jgi:ABC-2 type transport system ATP-binding protein
MNAIETVDLSKTYENGVDALKDLDVVVGRGEIFGFLGPNGAGKTTTVRLLNGTLNPSGGTFKLLGKERQDNDIRFYTATLGEQAHMYENLSAYENLRFFARMYEVDATEADSRIGSLLERMELWDRRHDKLGTFSTGMKKRVQLIRTMLHRPEIVFLDEPTAGLDPDAAGQVTNLIRKLAREQETTVFLCTHNLPLAERICDSFGFLSDGVMVKSGRKQELIESVMDTLRVKITTTKETYEYEIEDESEINGYLTEHMNKGEYITGVEIPKPSLEEVYFSYIGRSDNELG